MIVHVTDLALIERMRSTLEPLFAKATALTNGCYAPEDVLAELQNGQQQLWVACDDANARQIEAVMTTAICAYPRRKAIRVIYIAGEKMDRWFGDFVKHIEAFGTREGATLLQGAGRRGWGRQWPGLQECGTVFCKDLAA